MTSPRLRPDVTPVRPLGRPEPPEPPRGWVIAVLTGLAGLAGGYLIGAGTVPSPVIPDIEDIPPPTLVVEEVEPVQEAEGAGAALEDAQAPRGVPLVELVPGFRYLLWIAGLQISDGIAVPDVWLWPPTTASPASMTTVDLGGAELSMDISGQWLASRGGGTLRTGERAGMSRLMDHVHSYVWHETVPATLAWIEQRPGSIPTLHTGTVEAYGVYFRPVVKLTDFDYVAADPVLMEFDDLGFVLQSESRVYSLGPTGRLVAASDGAYLGGGSDGMIAMTRGGGEGLGQSLQLVDQALRGERGLGIVALGPVEWSNDRTRIALVDPTSDFALTIWSETEATVSIPLDTSWAEVEAWSPDDRFVVLTGGRRPGRQVMIFVDTLNGVAYYVQPGFTVQQIVVTEPPAPPVGAGAPARAN